MLGVLELFGSVVWSCVSGTVAFSLFFFFFCFTVKFYCVFYSRAIEGTGRSRVFFFFFLHGAVFGVLHAEGCGVGDVFGGGHFWAGVFGGGFGWAVCGHLCGRVVLALLSCVYVWGGWV